MTVLPFGEALAQIVNGLEQVGVPYFLGGSVATVLYGEIRTTQDVDIVVELQIEHVPPLVAALTPAFFVDETFLRDAIARGSSCNLIHRATGFKVDLFTRRNRAFSRTEMARRRPVPMLPGLTPQVASAEDCVLTKLEWFEKGGRVSERQWRDILGVLKNQRGALDAAYLRHWASELGIGDLLDLALRDAGASAS